MKIINEIVSMRTWYPRFEFSDIKYVSQIKLHSCKRSCFFSLFLKGDKIWNLCFKNHAPAQELHMILSFCLVSQIS
jgi:hypothetical protein